MTSLALRLLSVLVVTLLVSVEFASISSPPSRPLTDQELRSEQLESARQFLRALREARNQLVDQLILGQITLDDAAIELRESRQPCPVAMKGLCRWAESDASIEGCRRTLIACVGARFLNDPERREQVLKRITGN